MQFARFLLAPFALLLLGVVVFVDYGARSPGPISAAHAQVPELLGARSCDVCHGAEGETLAGACNTCHEEIGDQVLDRTGAHGLLSPVLADDCGKCHMEHRGRGFQPIGDRAFQLAGIRDGVQGFTHEGLNFELSGNHGELSCVECHEHADDDPLPEGCKRFLGKDQSCASCHEDPHEGQLQDCD